jgi:hypothetical protein
MKTKMSLRSMMLAACATLAMASGVARAAEVPLVTGEQWTQSTTEVKKVYLIGIANTLQVESAYEGATPPGDAQSLVPRFVKGLKGQTLDSVRERLDSWYAAHPDKLKQPVLETVWFEIVVPAAPKSK